MHELYLNDPCEHLAAIRRVNGTCEWLIQKEEYKSWIQGAGPQVLLLSGPPRSGKTTICSYLIDQLRQKATQTPEKKLLYFFCDSGDDKSNTGISILRGLIWQLLYEQPELFKCIRHYYKSRGKSFFKSFGGLWGSLKTILSTLSDDIYLLIDAPDECNEPWKNLLLHLVQELCNQGQPHKKFRVKLFITCRPTSDVQGIIEDGRLSCYRLLEVDSVDICGDISRFIESHVESLAGLPSKRNLLSNELQSDIREVLNQGGGTFLWASLLIRDLAESCTAVQVKEKLEAFPSSLYQVYDKLLTQIRVDLVKEAKHLFSWVILARQPMTSCELMDAFSFSPGLYTSTTYSQVNNTRLKYVIRCCEPLVHVDTKTNTINLLHQSVRDYFVGPALFGNDHLSRFYVDVVRANFMMFQACWSCLQGEITSDRHVGIQQDENSLLHPTPFSEKAAYTRPFIRYAIREWKQHALALNEANLREFVSLSNVFDKVEILRDAWLLLAAEEGRDDMVRLLLTKEADLTVKNRYGDTALHLAAYKGHIETAKIVIESGLDVNIINTNGQTALHRAAFQRQEKTALLLLESGADPDVKDFSGQTALHKATFSSCKEIVTLLLPRLVDIDGKDHIGQTCLHLSAANGDEDITSRLFANRAGVHTKDSNGWTALHWAVIKGREKIAHLILQKGADVNESCKHGQTPLHQAASNGDGILTRLLIEHSVHIQKQDVDGWTALHRAAFNGHQVVVQLLIERGANINIEDNDGKSASQRAYQNRHDIIVKQLSEANTIIAQRLHSAANTGDIGTVMQQIQQGGNINAADQYGWTALHWATEQGHKSLVQFLIEANADLNMQDPRGQTGLHRAVIKGHEAIAQLLVEKGADVNIHNIFGQNALHQAAFNGCQKIVRLLIDNGANINAKDHNGKSALKLAADHHHDVIVQQLSTRSKLNAGS
jgi:ankyrin repeat domain-containing protein 50